jgi:predicted ABC-type ATPase
MTIMKEARKAEYRIVLVYVALKDPELHIERVRLRVSQGGHDIPDADIRRRYARSLMRAPEALSLADEAVVLDNSGLYPLRMLLFENGVVVWRAEMLAEWVCKLAGLLKSEG